MKKGTNSASMRIKNEKIILSLINKAPVSRVDIAKKTGLTKAAVTIIVDDLLKRDIITQQEGRSESVGRNPVMLYLNHQAFYTIGIYITRQHISVGITDLGGDMVAEEKIRICAPDKAMDVISDIIYKMLEKSCVSKEKIYKIAVVTPGPVDGEHGVILNPPNFKEWHNFPIGTEIENRVGIKVVLENVSSATAIAEKYFGSALNVENFLTILVDDGIGSGIIVNDSLFKGPCELGHTSIKYDGIQCECGNRGCLEKYASVPQILKDSEFQTWKEAVDFGCVEIIEKEAEYLSTAITSANNLFDFDKIVLCGDLTYKPNEIVELISNKLKENVLLKKTVEVCSGKVESKIMIASSMAIHDFFI